MNRLVWCLIFVSLSGASLNAKMVDPIRSGSWKGGAFLNDKTGKLVSCMASGRYKSGIIVSIGILRSRGFLLGFASKDWKYEPGSFVVEGKVDNNRWTNLTVEALSEGDGFSLPLEPTAKRILRAGRILKIRDGDKVYSFKLTGTSDLIDALDDCVSRRLAMEASAPIPDQAKRGISTSNAPDGAPAKAPLGTRNGAHGGGPAKTPLGIRNDGAGDGGVQTARRETPKVTPPSVTRKDAVGSENSGTSARRARRKKKLSTGTGFFVTEAGHFVTNRRVVAECQSIRVAYAGEKYHDANLITAARQDDLAVLKTSLKPRSFATFRSGDRPKLGERVVVFGFPYYGVLAKSGNLATGNISALAGLRNATSQYQISAPMQPGNSGGPILGSGGNVIAVAQSKLNAIRVAKATGDIPQNVNFAIKGSVVLEFLETQDVKYKTQALGKPLAVSEIAARAKDFTIIVRCSS